MVQDVNKYQGEPLKVKGLGTIGVKICLTIITLQSDKIGRVFIAALMHFGSSCAEG